MFGLTILGLLVIVLLCQQIHELYLQGPRFLVFLLVVFLENLGKIHVELAMNGPKTYPVGTANKQNSDIGRGIIEKTRGKNPGKPLLPYFTRKNSRKSLLFTLTYKENRGVKVVFWGAPVGTLLEEMVLWTSQINTSGYSPVRGGFWLKPKRIGPWFFLKSRLKTCFSACCVFVGWFLDH